MLEEFRSMFITYTSRHDGSDIFSLLLFFLKNRKRLCEYFTACVSSYQ
jgi:hypothetical protein